MGSKIVNLEIFLIYFFLLIPWPHTHVIKRLCSKDSSRLVRKIVRSKWTPILDKYQVKLPLECPLHPFRDIFAPRQDAKKRDRPTQWTCRLCGKSFYQEKFLDLHFETRHKNVINEAEDAVCLADYCDIMRCEVFQSEESSSLKLGDQTIVTDIEVWGDSFGQNSALAKANVAYLSLLPIRTSSTGASSRAAKVQNRQYCQDKIGQTKCQQTDSHQNSNENLYNYNSGAANTATRSKFSQTPQSSADSLTSSAAPHIHVHSSSSSSKTHHGHKHSSSSTTSGTKATHTTTKQNNTPKDKSTSDEGSKRSKGGEDNDDDDDDDGDDEDDANSSKTNANASSDDSNKTSSAQLTNMQKIRANCKAEELSKLKAKCEYLVRSCIGGLILSMTDQQFKDMEEEMNKAVCWYLTCERYWEDGPLEPRAFPWGLILILIFVLSTGICFCYYIIWILFDSEETTINATTNHHHLYIPTHQHYHPQHLQQQQQQHHQQQQLHHAQQQTIHQDHYLFQDYPTTGIHHGMTNVEPQTNTSYYYQHHPQQHQQQQQAQVQAQQAQQQAELHHHQQAMQHDIYPEPVQYDYRHSPRRYIGDQRLPGTPTITMTGGATIVGGGQTPLHRQQQTQNLAYQQDILDRRDYISRPIATSVVTGGVGGVGGIGPNSGSTGALSHHSAQMDCDNTLPATHLGSASSTASMVGGGGGGGVKHYNTIPRPLETRQRYVSGSQQSLRASSSSHDIIQNEVGHNEHYIYVTYPPDLKKRFFEKYE